jgi:hypothetical protein
MVPELIARTPERTEGREALSAIDAWIAEWREPYGRRVDKATHARRFLPQARGYGRTDRRLAEISVVVRLD